MHELYIAQCILSSVKSSLPEGIEPSAVEEVRVRVGKLDAVIPDTLHFLFDAIKTDAGLGNASLKIDEEEIACRCRTCGKEFTLSEPLFLCPACGGGDIEVLRGRGITLMSIKAQTAEE